MADDLALVKRRIRDGVVLTFTDVYRVTGDVLRLEVRRSQTQRDGSLVKMEDPRSTVIYRRIR